MEERIVEDTPIEKKVDVKKLNEIKKSLNMDDIDDVKSEVSNHSKFTLNNIIKVKIQNEKDEYIFIIDNNKVTKEYNLLFYKNDYEITNIKKINISKEYYEYFINMFYIIIKDWQDYYLGKSDVNFTIDIEDELYRKISGKGGFPTNWNEFLDLLIQYEIYFKKYNLSENKDDVKINMINIDKDILDNALAKKYIREMKDEIDEEMVKKGLLIETNGDKIPLVGSSAVRWNLEKELLKERYNINWKIEYEK